MNVAQGEDWLSLDLGYSLHLNTTHSDWSRLHIIVINLQPKFFFDFSVRTGVRLLVRKPVSQRAY